MIRNGSTGDWIGTFVGHKGAVWGVALDDSGLLAATGGCEPCDDGVSFAVVVALTPLVGISRFIRAMFTHPAVGMKLCPTRGLVVVRTTVNATRHAPAPFATSTTQCDSASVPCPPLLL